MKDNTVKKPEPKKIKYYEIARGTKPINRPKK